MNPISYAWTSIRLQSQSAMVSNTVLASKMKQPREETRACFVAQGHGKIPQGWPPQPSASSLWRPTQCMLRLCFQIAGCNIHSNYNPSNWTRIKQKQLMAKCNCKYHLHFSKA